MSNQPTVSRWLDRSGYLLLAALIVLPAFLIPRFLHEAVKIGTEYHVVVVAWALAAVLGTARALEGRSIAAGGEGSWFRRAMIAFAGWLALSTLWAEQPAIHLAYAASTLALLWAGQALIGWLEVRPARRNYVFALLAVLLASEAAIALAQHAHLFTKALFKYATPGGYVDGWLTAVGSRGGRGVTLGTLGNPNYLAELLVLLLTATGGWAAGRPSLRVRALMAVPLIGGLAALLYASSRAAALGLVVGAVAAVAITGAWRSFDFRAWWGEPRRRAALIAGAVGLVVVAAMAGGKLANKVGGTFENDFSVESRLINWRAAVGVWASKPIQGHGLGGWKRESGAVLAAQHPNGLPESSSASRFIQVHNEPLQALTELGLVGFGLLLGGFLAWLRETSRNEALALPARVGLVAAAIGLLVTAGFGFPFHVPLTAMAIVVVLALGVAKDPEPMPAAPLPAWRWGYALAALVLIGGTGKLLVDRGVGPAYTASMYNQLAQHVQRKDRKAKGSEILYLYAAEADRFKAAHVFAALQVLGAQKRYKDVVETYDRYQDHALAVSGRALRARALAELGRKEEAIADFKAVANFYHPSASNYRVAYRGLKDLGITIAKPVRKGQQPAAVASPAASPSPTTSASPALGNATDTDEPDEGHGDHAATDDDEATGDKDEDGEAEKADGASS